MALFNIGNILASQDPSTTAFLLTTCDLLTYVYSLESKSDIGSFLSEVLLWIVQLLVES